MHDLKGPCRADLSIRCLPWFLSFSLKHFSLQAVVSSCFYRPETRLSKKKKLKININRPLGNRVVFDEEGNVLPPLATISEKRVTMSRCSLIKVLFLHFQL